MRGKKEKGEGTEQKRRRGKKREKGGARKERKDHDTFGTQAEIIKAIYGLLGVQVYFYPLGQEL